MWRRRKKPEDTSCTWLWRWSIRNRVYSKKEQSDPTLSIRRWWWWWTRCMRLGQCEFSSSHFSEREINSRFQLEVEIFKHIENIGCQIKSSVPTGTPLLQLLGKGTLKTSKTKQVITIALNRPPGLDFNTYCWEENTLLTHKSSWYWRGTFYSAGWYSQYWKTALDEKSSALLPGFEYHELQ